MAKWPFLPWRQSSASKYRPDTLNYGCISTSKSGEFSVGDANNKAVPVMPVGCVIPFAGAAAPTGWLLCQGQAVSRTTYAQLFSVIGTTYGSGDGKTTFNLPDMRGRVAVGSDANSPGVKVGTKGAAIQDYNLPGNTVIAPIKIDSGWGFGHWQSWADADNIATTTSNAGNAFTNLGIMQPSLYLNYVVKV